MKVSNMATEPISGTLAVLALKAAGLATVVGALGGAIMAVFDPPKSRREMFLQAAVAGSGSLVFGHLGAAAAAHYISFLPAEDMKIPAYFLVGAMSWGVFGALAKVRRVVADKAADKIIERTGL